jgi:hypothetical protein
MDPEGSVSKRYGRYILIWMLISRKITLLWLNQESERPQFLIQIRIRYRYWIKILVFATLRVVFIQFKKYLFFAVFYSPEGKLVAGLGLERDCPVLGVAGLRRVAAQHSHVSCGHAQQPWQQREGYSNTKERPMHVLKKEKTVQVCTMYLPPF